MNRTHTLLSAITALTLVSTGVFGAVVSRATPAPGEVTAGEVRIVAAVDSSSWLQAGDTALGVPFSHAAKVSGSYSVSLDGAPLRVGEVVAGYLVGCAIDVSQGIGIAIAPEVGAAWSISPSIGGEAAVDFGLVIDAPLAVEVPQVVEMPPMGEAPEKAEKPSTGEAPQKAELPLGVQLPLEVGVGFGGNAGLAQTFGVEGAIAGELAVGLAPGAVTALPIGAAVLDGLTTFPYTFAHTTMPLHINGCLAQASAMPFITVRAHTFGSTVQTTGYGDSFTF